MGSDAPFPLGEPEPVNFVRNALPADQADAIWAKFRSPCWILTMEIRRPLIIKDKVAFEGGRPRRARDPRCGLRRDRKPACRRCDRRPRRACSVRRGARRFSGARATAVLQAPVSLVTAKARSSGRQATSSTQLRSFIRGWESRCGTRSAAGRRSSHPTSRSARPALRSTCRWAQGRCVVFRHIDTMTIHVPGAPRPDEIVVSRCWPMAAARVPRRQIWGCSPHAGLTAYQACAGARQKKADGVCSSPSFFQ